jgi:hypothetical protein
MMKRTANTLRIVRRLSLLLLLLCGFIASQEVAQAQVSACEQCGINEVYCLSLADGEYLYCTDLADYHYDGCMDAALDHQFGCYLDCAIDFGWDPWFEDICDSGCDMIYEMEGNICANALSDGYNYCSLDRTIRQGDCATQYEQCTDFYNCP